MSACEATDARRGREFECLDPTHVVAEVVLRTDNSESKKAKQTVTCRAWLEASRVFTLPHVSRACTHSVTCQTHKKHNNTKIVQIWHCVQIERQNCLFVHKVGESSRVMGCAQEGVSVSLCQFVTAQNLESQVAKPPSECLN